MIHYLTLFPYSSKEITSAANASSFSLEVNRNKDNYESNKAKPGVSVTAVTSESNNSRKPQVMTTEAGTANDEFKSVDIGAVETDATPVMKKSTVSIQETTKESSTGMVNVNEMTLESTIKEDELLCGNDSAVVKAATAPVAQEPKDLIQNLTINDFAVSAVNQGVISASTELKTIQLPAVEGEALAEKIHVKEESQLPVETGKKMAIGNNVAVLRKEKESQNSKESKKPKKPAAKFTKPNKVAPLRNGAGK